MDRKLCVYSKTSLTDLRTCQGGQMSRVSTSHPGRSGIQITGSNLDLTVFKPWSSQTDDFKINTCLSLAWCSALLGYGKDWLAPCEDNATEWDNRSWCQQPGVLVRQHYKVTMSAHCHTSVPVPPLGLSHNCEALLHTSLDH